jgi:hypothetical protein
MCMPGFREYKGKCSKCNYAIDKYITMGTLTIFFLLIIFMVKNVLSSAVKTSTTSVMSKILVNHMQMLIITASFDMNWPDVVQQLFDVAAPIEIVTQQITAFDCWMDNRDPTDIQKFLFEDDPNFIAVSFQKTMIMSALPIIIMLISYSIWFLMYKCKQI